MDANGENRQVLRQGPPLPEITGDLARFNDIDHIGSAIHTPVWSPDGKHIAFIQNGLQRLDLDSSQVEHIWHQSITSSEPNIFESLLSWSPDGDHLLVSLYPYPLENLYQRKLFMLKLGEYLFDINDMTHGTSFAWSPNMEDIYLANAFAGSDRSLMRCNLASMQCALIAEFEPARWYYFYAFPFVKTDERLLVFMGSSDDYEKRPEAFHLVSLQSNGFGRNQLRDDGNIPQFALWSPNGDGVVITLDQEVDAFPAGSTLWLSTSNGPMIPLPMMNASNMRWGNTP
jgi:hypothetical protein